MKITALEVHVLRAPDDGRPHWVSHFIVPKANEILVRTPARPRSARAAPAPSDPFRRAGLRSGSQALHPRC